MPQINNDRRLKSLKLIEKYIKRAGYGCPQLCANSQTSAFNKTPYQGKNFANLMPIANVG